jgi:hypothetical protein
MIARMLSDYCETLVGELSLGAPDTLRTHMSAFYWAAWRAVRELLDPKPENCRACGKLIAHEPGCKDTFETW